MSKIPDLVSYQFAPDFYNPFFNKLKEPCKIYGYYYMSNPRIHGQRFGIFLGEEHKIVVVILSHYRDIYYHSIAQYVFVSQQAVDRFLTQYGKDYFCIEAEGVRRSLWNKGWEVTQSSRFLTQKDIHA